MKLDNGFDYGFGMSNGNVAKGKMLTIDASALDMTHHLTVNGSAGNARPFCPGLA